MQVSKQSVYQFLEGCNKTFVIPVYQRDYSWRYENCKKLWDDFLDLKITKKPSHFLGTFVNIYDKQDERLIVDGQQRLTTVSLLLLALENFLKQKTDKTPEESILQEQLLEFLINKYSLDKSKRVRLKPNKQDQQYFNQLFEEKLEFKHDSNILNNYQFFYEKIQSEELKPIELFEIFQKLEIVNIELERQFDDPQLIFESLNSTGVDLNDGDLIRNYILMDLEPQKQEDLYAKYWIKLENLTGNNVAEFVRNFLMFKLQKNVTQTKRAVYNEFKKYSEEKFAKDSQKILENLLIYAQIYSYLIRQNQHPKKIINHNLERLYNLEFKVSHPFLFEVFDLYQQKIIDANIVAQVIHLIESYAFRRILVANTTQGLNKLFLTLGKEIKKIAPENWQDKFFDIMSFIIKNKTASQKFPTDDEFREALLTKEIYKLRSKNRDFLFESLENYNSSYKVDLSNLSIEHIMPQSINQKWKEALGSDWEDIHSNYLHTLGNLTLISPVKNSEASNKDFQSKQEIDLQSSPLKLSYQLRNIQDWNKDAIVNRSKKLAEEAIDIWQYPKTTFKKAIKKSDIYILDENLDLRNTKPKTMFIGEEKINIDHWWEVKKIICQKFYQESPTEFKEMMQKSDITRYFAENKENNLLSSYEFQPNCFVDIHGSTFDIFRFTIKLCECFNFDVSEISFEVRQGE